MIKFRFCGRKAEGEIPIMCVWASSVAPAITEDEVVVRAADIALTKPQKPSNYSIQ